VFVYKTVVLQSSDISIITEMDYMGIDALYCCGLCSTGSG